MSKKKLNSINKIDPGGSGLEDFKKKDYEEKLRAKSLETDINREPAAYINLFSLFLLQDNNRLEDLLAADPSLIASLEIKALRLLNLVVMAKNPDLLTKLARLTNLRAPDPELASKLSHRLSKKIIDIFALVRTETTVLDNFVTAKLLDLNKISPEVQLYYALFFLLSPEQDLTNILDLISSYEVKSPLDEQMKIYLQALYYRRVGDDENAEKYQNLYRDIYQPDFEKPTKLTLLSNKKFYLAKDVLPNWQEVLAELDQLQAEVNLRAGLLRDTCAYFACADCCKMTFPVMTLTEYLYLKNWLINNGYDLAALRAKAEKIQREYHAQYGERLAIVDKSQTVNQLRGIENPHDFKYTCPFLDDGGACSCYEARPLLCRGFGLSTDNGLAIKTCNYYLAQYQHNTNPYNERFVYDLRPVQMLAKSSDKYLLSGNLSEKLSDARLANFEDTELTRTSMSSPRNERNEADEAFQINSSGKHLAGTIVAWLSQDKY